MPGPSKLSLQVSENCHKAVLNIPNEVDKHFMVRLC